MPRITFEQEDSAELLAEICHFVDTLLGERVAKLASATGRQLPALTEDTPDPTPAQPGPLAVASSPAEGPAILPGGPPNEDAPTAAELAPSPAVAAQVAAITGAPAAASSAPQLPLGDPATNGPVATVELDKDGLPFDGRIHSVNRKTKTGVKKADGGWRMKRGVDAALIALVTAGLKARTGEALGATVALATPIGATPPVPANPDTSLVGADVGATIALATQLVECVSDEAGLRAIGDEMRAVIAPFGMASINDLLNNPDAAPAIHTGLLLVKAKWMPGQ